MTINRCETDNYNWCEWWWTAKLESSCHRLVCVCQYRLELIQQQFIGIEDNILTKTTFGSIVHLIRCILMLLANVCSSDGCCWDISRTNYIKHEAFVSSCCGPCFFVRLDRINKYYKTWKRKGQTETNGSDLVFCVQDTKWSWQLVRQNLVWQLCQWPGLSDWYLLIKQESQRPLDEGYY